MPQEIERLVQFYTLLDTRLETSECAVFHGDEREVAAKATLLDVDDIRVRDASDDLVFLDETLEQLAIELVAQLNDLEDDPALVGQPTREVRGSHVTLAEEAFYFVARNFHFVITGVRIAGRSRTGTGPSSG
jgi:hypothetical protein